MDNCEKCVYFKQTEDGKTDQCTRFPPKGSVGLAQFPSIKRDWYCGEFKKK
jgi:hypothetical protein